MIDVINAFHHAGTLAPVRMSAGRPRALVVHRNTVGSLYRSQHPDFTGSEPEAILRWFSAPTDGVTRRLMRFPYHFVIGEPSRDGLDARIWQMHALDEKGAHASERNRDTISVAVTVDGRTQEPSGPMLLALSCLMATLISRWHNLEIERHRLDGRYACPGRMVPVESLAEQARQRAKCTPEPDVRRIVWERVWA